MTATGDRWRCPCGAVYTPAEVADTIRSARGTRKHTPGRLAATARCTKCKRPLADTKLEKEKPHE